MNAINAEKNAIEAAGVSIRYGRRTVVSDVSLSVAKGSVYALLGRNGAGKSSLVRCLLGQLAPSSGSVTMFGEDVWRCRAALMDRVGIVTEDADAPPESRVGNLARFSSQLYSRWTQSAFDERIARFGIAADRRFGDLSKGQKKQVMLALALAASPDLLILDDPTLGLDVVARKSLFEEVIGDMADRGITIFVTTHDLSSVEARFRRIRFASQPVALQSATLIAADIRKWGNGTEAIVTNYDDLAFERFRNESELASADVSAMSLEEIFIAVAGEEQGARS
jgi:ABC-type multidrug transport system ATPase subunit